MNHPSDEQILKAPRASGWRHLRWSLLGAAALLFAPAAPSSAQVPRAPLPTQIQAASAEALVAHGRYRGRYRGRSFYRPRLGFYSGFYGWGRPYFGYYGPYFRGGFDGYYGYRPDAGAVDTDIRPEKARIYIDGEHVGVADNFDGFPRYLWLKPGTYNMVVYMEGFETLKRRLKVEAGVIIDMNDRMVPGEATLPEEIFGETSESQELSESRETVREDASRERARVAPRRAQPRVPAPRSRVPARVSPRDTQDEEMGELDRVRQGQLPADQRGEPGRLSLEVSPNDAVVYLDGRLLGSGAELGRLHSDLLVDPGSHTLEVTRPGYETKTVEFDVRSGERVELNALLDQN